MARGTVNAAELRFRGNITAVVSSRCTQEALEIARLSYFWRLPVINRVGRTPELFDNVYYPTLVHVGLKKCGDWINRMAFRSPTYR